MRLSKNGFILLAMLWVLSSANALEIGFAGGKSDGWTYSLGSEFPGAEGNFALMPGEGPGGSCAGRMEGDFRHGGAYVAISCRLKKPMAFKEIRILLRNAGAYQKMVARLVDETGQTHQILVPLKPDRENWQTVTLYPAPGYSSWGGASDRRWHGKLLGISLMGEGRALPHNQSNGRLYFSTVDIRPDSEKAKAVEKQSGESGVQTGGQKETLAINPGLPGWRFTKGDEFPGASGTIRYDNGAIRLNIDFTKKSAYVAVSHSVNFSGFDELRFQVKGSVATIGVRFHDAGNQCHLHLAKVQADPQNWTDVTVPVKTGAKAHWGGARDGVVRFPMKKIDILVFRQGQQEPSSPQVEIKDIALYHSANSTTSK